ncbi:hypothetical protein QO200_06810 [Flavobacterium sp. Arc3]|uniref:hypothetical protein n=1 Tax=Flavobacterium sp. Arc3 TaxID=3046686 RepID=UPI00352FD73C
MKTSLKIFSALLFFFSVQTKAQTVSDTLQYLKTNFELKKANYIGKPFSRLLTDLKIQPTQSWHITPFRKKYSVISTDFYFLKKGATYTNRTIVLSIYWQEEIPKSTVEIYENKNGYLFTSDERTFYGNKIVKDIKVYR